MKFHERLNALMQEAYFNAERATPESPLAGAWSRIAAALQQAAGEPIPHPKEPQNEQP